MTQTQLAERMGELGVPVSQSAIAAFEKWGTGDHRSRRPSFAHMLSMAVILQVRPRQLGVTIDEYPEFELVRDYPEFATPG